MADEEKQSLPIALYREQLVAAVAEYPVVVVVGDTGSGKTTQLAQYLLGGLRGEAEREEQGEGEREAEGGKKLRIAVTQPRRIAAISAAVFVAGQSGSALGGTVGYAVRFDAVRSARTRLTFMTDGALLAQLCHRRHPHRRSDMRSDKHTVSDNDRHADARAESSDSDSDAPFPFDIVILDEAHERSIETDLLFGLLKPLVCPPKQQQLLLPSRPAIKLIIMSATLDADKFCSFFDDAPVFSIPGRMFPVSLLYAPKMPMSALKSQIIQKSVDTVMHIHSSEEIGDILVFLPGQYEIETTSRLILQESRLINPKLTLKYYPSVREISLHPIYSALDTPEQRDAFRPAKFPYIRKVVIATNIAQTSVTIPGIRYVVDCGFVKEKIFDQSTGVDALTVVPISKAAATQRAGRSGRTAPGKVFRLYSRDAFDELELDSTPEIQRASLVGTVLTLKQLGISDVLGFDFIDPPDRQSLVDAMKQLYYLKALDADGIITQHGKDISRFPISPFFATALLTAPSNNCTADLLTLAALLSSEEIFLHPRDEHKRGLADRAHARFAHPSGDHISLLRLYNAWLDNGESDAWCTTRFLKARSLRNAKNVRMQLEDIMRILDVNVSTTCRVVSAADFDSKKKSLAATAKRKRQEQFQRPSRRHSIDYDDYDCHAEDYEDDDDKDFLAEYDSKPILKSICAGFFINTAKRHPHRPSFYHYLSSTSATASNSNSASLSLHVSPTSCLFGSGLDSDGFGSNSGVRGVTGQNLDWVVYHDLQFVRCANMRIVSRIDFRWVQEGIERVSGCNVARLIGDTLVSKYHDDGEGDGAVADGTAENAKKIENGAAVDGGRCSGNGHAVLNFAQEKKDRDEKAEAAKARYLVRKKK
ncbi:ATP-dependent RNA helicase dhx8 [Physocladia obscura]|uniref:ATP-dependent RNA helicase dhx8 n=1 Tax=Physocladia obscura TaxID=109957 RepID=A0AAD5T800_9FUNG|nr:ATP-dependent RNA helicase dhx8 [Physocladia obscura]